MLAIARTLVVAAGCLGSLAAQTVYVHSPNRLPQTTAPRVVYTPPQVQHIPAKVYHDASGNVVYQPARVVYQAPEITCTERRRRHGVLYERVTVATSPVSVHTRERPVHSPCYRTRVLPRVRVEPRLQVRFGHRHRYYRHRCHRPRLRVRPGISFHIDL